MCFGRYLVTKHAYDEWKQIQGYVNCRVCRKTYNYSSSSAISHLIGHSCVSQNTKKEGA